MKKTLRKTITFSYMILIIICVVFISFLTNFFLEKQFKNYVIKEHGEHSKDIVESLSNQYTESGKWNSEFVQKIGIEAIENGMFITLKDTSENVVWDASAYNNMKCEQMKEHLTNNMLMYFHDWKTVYTKNEYPIISNGNKIGTVEIGYCGPYYFNDNDILYLRTLNKILLSVGLVSLLVAVIVGILMAGAISKPILKVIDTAQRISEGNYNQKIDKKSDIEEINRLINSINELGVSLYKQEKLRKTLTRDISHELRTPLTTLQSHMEAIIDGIWEPSVERIVSCHEEILRLKRLVGDLESLSKYESENLILNKLKFNIGDVINNIVLNFEKEFLNKGVNLFFNSKDVFITADKDKISQVIVNLISNALKYTDKDGKVEISISEDKEQVKISVKDSGIGMSEKDLPNVFERFYRADESRNRSTGGAGIGLTITKAIVEAHNGEINVVSKVNEGSEFTVIIPLINIGEKTC